MVRIPPWESCAQHFKELGILTLPSLYILVLLTGFFKRRSKYESHLEQVHREATRRRDLKNIINPRLNIVKHSPQYQSIQLFNKLPVELKNISNISVFQRKVKDLLLEKCYYSIKDF